jgi:hypothetical protein
MKFITYNRKKRLSDLYEELDAVNAQKGRELSDVNRIRLQRQADEIEQAIYFLVEDHFYYRWAASRCLKLIHPGSQLEYIVVERPQADPQRPATEYVINVAEYWKSDRNSIPRIAYFQLKQATANENQPLTLTDLRNTLQGFAARYSDHFCGAEPPN